MEDPHVAIRNTWTGKAYWYANESKNTIAFASLLHSYIHLLDLANASSVLEVGCGTGNGIPIILENANPSAAITATDLTPAFLDIARSASYPRTTILEANSEFLPFEDESFDRYIANMSLMIVHNPENMLKEACRVVKPGSICGFSVWGSEQGSSIKELPKSVLDSIGIRLESSGRSNFHLNDKQRLRTMVLGAGFSKCYMFEKFNAYPTFDPDEVMAYYRGSPFLKPLRGTPDYDRAHEAIREGVSKYFDEGNLLGLFTIIVIAIK